MRDFGAWVARRRREAGSSARLDAHLVTPSLRDVGSALRTGRRDLVGIPTVSPTAASGAVELVDRVLAADVAALAVAADPGPGASLTAMRALSEQLPSTPLLLLDPVVVEGQVLEGRLAGADAVALPVGFLDEAEIRRLAQVARSTLMAPMFVVRTVAEWETACRADARFLLVSSPDGALAPALDLSRRLPPQVSSCLWVEGLDSAKAVRALAGSADGALLGTDYPLSSWTDVAVVEPER